MDAWLHPDRMYSESELNNLDSVAACMHVGTHTGRPDNSKNLEQNHESSMSRRYDLAEDLLSDSPVLYSKGISEGQFWLIKRSISEAEDALLVTEQTMKMSPLASTIHVLSPRSKRGSSSKPPYRASCNIRISTCSARCSSPTVTWSWRTSPVS